MMKPTRRQITHETNRDEIKTIALKHIADNGAAALSLGAVAREMGLTTPALYRYFPGRSELLAALIADAYNALTDAMLQSQQTLPPADIVARFRAVSLAYFTWAKAHPQQYLLMFGSPIPSTEFVAEAGQAADRSFLLILDLLDSADRAGKLSTPFNADTLPAGLKQHIGSVHHPEKEYSSKVTYLALVSWSFLHGMTSLDICQRYTLILGETAAEFLQVEVDRFMRYIGLV
jgi:AcrR family transcriptional regulator